MKGKIVTFYSYKGGVGRSMALANVAALLAQKGHRVLVVDFDLEAPGLHRYLLGMPASTASDEPDPPPAATRPGLIDFMYDLRHRLTKDFPIGTAPRDGAARVPDEVLSRYIGELLDSGDYYHEVRLDNPDQPAAPARLSFMAAGRLDPGYSELVRDFDWRDFYDRYAEVFPVLAAELKRRFAYVLIDSRTGLTDVGSICTVELPDELVLCFVPNWQSLDGVLEVGYHAATQHRDQALIPLLMRVEDAEHEQRDEWIARAKGSFEDLLREIYKLDRCDLTAYFDDVRIPHVSYYSYGEKIAATRERTSVGLAAAFSKLIPFIHGYQPWEAQVVRRAPPALGTVRALVLHAEEDFIIGVQPVLRQLSSLGIRPWLPEQEGSTWQEALNEALKDPIGRTVLVFWSRTAARDPAFCGKFKEILQHPQQGDLDLRSLILGSMDDVELPDELAALLGSKLGPLPAASINVTDPHVADKIARRIFKIAGLAETEEFVLHLGHRRSLGDADVPESWRHLPVLDLRHDLVGDRDFSPSEAQWSEIRDRTQMLHDLLPAARQINVCGQAPLGVGAIVGKTWDRGSGTVLQTYSTFNEQIWTSALSPQDQAASGQWTPEAGVQVHIPAVEIPPRTERLLLALIPLERADYMANVDRWNTGREGPTPVVWVQTPIAITSPDQARLVLVEVLGALRYLRRTFPAVQGLDLVASLPLAEVVLLGHHLRQFGEVNFFDQVMRTKDYRLAVSYR